MSKISRRSFLTVSAATASGGSMLRYARATEKIAGFDQTKIDYDSTQVWKPFSDRKVRVGIVGHGVCKFG
ncbi:MAG: gfo/Idh/MocA family oxidoreductase, partial [Promethearchaeota archaeon]